MSNNWLPFAERSRLINGAALSLHTAKGLFARGVSSAVVFAVQCGTVERLAGVAVEQALQYSAAILGGVEQDSGSGAAAGRKT